MKQLPKPPKFSIALIGPGIVLIAMGLGSGEFVLWPYLVAQYGFGVLWGALAGLTLQYFVSNETGRYTIATGGSVYVGFHKLNKYLPYWFILSTYLAFAWPGIIGSGGLIVANLIGVEEHKYITLLMLLIIGLLLTFGGKVYSNLEKIQKIFILVSMPILLIIASLLIDLETTGEVAVGLVGKGNGYWFFPSGISILSFLGSIAYAGAGGNLVASHSFYLQDEGIGMAKHVDSQVSLKNDTREVEKGLKFEPTKENVKSFKGFFKVSAIEQFLSFWCIGLLSIILLSVISYVLVYPFNGEEGLDFIFFQSDGLKSEYGSIVGTFFLLVGATFLFTTQLGIFETTSRILSENILLAKPKIGEKFKRSNIFFFFLWSQIVLAMIITLLDISAPLQILLIGTFFSACSMFVMSGLVFLLNRSKLMPKEIRPGIIRTFLLVLAFLFFGVFVLMTSVDLIGVRF